MLQIFYLIALKQLCTLYQIEPTKLKQIKFDLFKATDFKF